jgi:hypothetical protein
MDLDQGYGHEQSFTLRLSKTPDAAEAVASTLEKRPPQWQWGRGGETWTSGALVPAERRPANAEKNGR